MTNPKSKVLDSRNFLEESISHEPTVQFFMDLSEENKEIVLAYMEAYCGYVIANLLDINPAHMEDEIKKILN